MSDTNNLEIIQNKLDALIEKIVQKENLDENFRITYAQILEKINTKMDLFSGNENNDKVGVITSEIKDAIQERQNIVDDNFVSIKSDFDNLKETLLASLENQELINTLENLQNQINKFSEEQENQKALFNSIVSHIEKSGTLDETNDNMKANFAIVKEQNTIVNENLTKQINLINNLNNQSLESNQKLNSNINSVILSFKEFKDSLSDDSKEIKTLISEKIDKIITNMQNTDACIENIDNNIKPVLNTMKSLFNNQEFTDMQSDVATILTKTAFISQAIEKLATKEDFNKHQEELLNQSKKTFTEQIIDIKNKIEKSQNDICSEVTDTISEESVAVSGQLDKISETIENLKNELTDVVLNQQNEQVTTTLNSIQTKFVSQLIQIAENITFDEEAEEINENIYTCAYEIKEKISSDISDIRQEFIELKDINNGKENNIITLLEKIDSLIQTDINNDLKTIIHSFKILTSGLKTDKDYVYTLPDVESDLSKIRLDINNLQKSISNPDANDTENKSDICSQISNIKQTVDKIEKNPVNSEITEIKSFFGALNEDVSSISKRTNKLILSSDEINKTLKNNIENFTSLLKSFERQSNQFYNSPFLLEFEKKINCLLKTSAALTHSDQIMNEAFMYLAEWVDSASESFDEIKDGISIIKNHIDATDNSANEQIARNIKTLNTRIDEQNSRIDSIEEKLDKILAQQANSKELGTLLEYIASQVSTTNEKIVENDKLAQRITNIEKQIKKIERNISIITKYIDEDDEDYDIE